MRAKAINEASPFQGKSEEEIQQIIDETGEAPADYIAQVLRTQEGYPFKVNFTGAWDKFGPVKEVEVTNINRGNGFEQAILVKAIGAGTFVYMAPFKIDSMPTDEMMFLFYAEDAIYIDGITFKKD